MGKVEMQLDMALDDVINAAASKGETKGKADGQSQKAGKLKPEKAADENTEEKLDMSLDDVIESAKGKGRKGKGKGEEGSQKKGGGEENNKWDGSWAGGGEGSKWYTNVKSEAGGPKSWGGGGSGGKTWAPVGKDDWKAKDSKIWGGNSKAEDGWASKTGNGGGWGKDNNKSWSGPRGGGDRESGRGSWGSASTSKHWDSGSGRDDRGGGSSRGTKRSYDDSGSSSRKPSSDVKRIKVSNIPKTLDWRDLKNAFEKEAGPVERCELRMGEAMITFTRPQDARRAVETFDRGELNGRTIGVELATETAHCAAFPSID